MEETKGVHPLSRPGKGEHHDKDNATEIDKLVVRKVEALELCKNCSGANQDSCISGDIESAKGDYIENPPECLLEQLKCFRNSVSINNNQDALPGAEARTNSSDMGCGNKSTAVIGGAEVRTSPYVTARTPQCTEQTVKWIENPDVPFKWDALYARIIQSIGQPSNGYSQNELISESGASPTTVRDRLKILEKHGHIFTREVPGTGLAHRSHQKIFVLTPRGANLYIHNVGVAADSENPRMVYKNLSEKRYSSKSVTHRIFKCVFYNTRSRIRQC